MLRVGAEPNVTAVLQHSPYSTCSCAPRATWVWFDEPVPAIRRQGGYFACHGCRVQLVTSRHLWHPPASLPSCCPRRSTVIICARPFPPPQCTLCIESYLWYPNWKSFYYMDHDPLRWQLKWEALAFQVWETCLSTNCKSCPCVTMRSFRIFV